MHLVHAGLGDRFPPVYGVLLASSVFQAIAAPSADYSDT
jgi:hypothetical protein